MIKALHLPVTHALFPPNTSNTDGCRVPALVNGRLTHALLDTGSTATLLHPDLLPTGTQPQATNLPLITVTGGEAPMLGRCEAQIQLGAYSVCQPVWVAEVKEDCLIGLDFLRSAKAVLDFNKRTITFPDGTSIPFLNDSLIPEMTEKVVGDDGMEWDPPCSPEPPQWEAPFTESLLPLSEDNLTTTDTAVHTKPHLPAVVQAATVAPMSEKESVAITTVKDLWEKNREGLHSEQQHRLWNLLHEYRHSFSTNPNDVGRTHLVQHSINTGDAQPIRQRPRRLPYARQAAANQMLQEMKDAGIIEPSESPWVSPVVMAPRKDGKLRFCVDFRPLNDKTVKDSYPLPRIDESLDYVAGSAWFSSLDLRSGYWQVAMAPEDKAKTAFTMGRGLWQFTTMPFGLCNAPATFERLMEKVLVGVPPERCLVYLDDLLVHGPSFDAALESLGEVLERIKCAGLKLHPGKCRLLQREVSFLGHRVSGAGIMTEPDKVAAVRDWPTPTDVHRLRSFLGLASYYRRFVAGFSTVAAPMFNLLRKDTPYKWGPDQDAAFHQLKQALCKDPVLVAPDPELPFILDTDASDTGLGAVLSQLTPEGERVVAYHSRTLDKPEKNYCVTRRELLVVIDAVNHFKHILCGLPFTIRTDHAALKWLMSFKEPEGQVARWIEQLQAFQFTIQHRAGESHTNADSLSRRPCAPGCHHCNQAEEREAANLHTGKVICRALLPDNERGWRELQLEDPDLEMVITWLEKDIRPPWDDVVAQSATVRGLWSQWPGVELQEGVLKRCWREPATGEPRWQVVVPKNLCKGVL